MKSTVSMHMLALIHFLVKNVKLIEIKLILHAIKFLKGMGTHCRENQARHRYLKYLKELKFPSQHSKILINNINALIFNIYC